MLVRQPLDGARALLLTRDVVLEDIFSQLVHTVQQAYIHKRRFVATVHRGWGEVSRAVASLWTTKQLVRPAWHLLCQVGQGTEPWRTLDTGQHEQAQYVDIGCRESEKFTFKCGQRFHISRDLDEISTCQLCRRL